MQPSIHSFLLRSIVFLLLTFSLSLPLSAATISPPDDDKPTTKQKIAKAKKALKACEKLTGDAKIKCEIAAKTDGKWKIGDPWDTENPKAGELLAGINSAAGTLLAAGSSVVSVQVSFTCVNAANPTNSSYFGVTNGNAITFYNPAATPPPKSSGLAMLLPDLFAVGRAQYADAGQLFSSVTFSRLSVWHELAQVLLNNANAVGISNWEWIYQQILTTPIPIPGQLYQEESSGPLQPLFLHSAAEGFAVAWSYEAMCSYNILTLTPDEQAELCILSIYPQLADFLDNFMSNYVQ